ncbi:hypothetical protein LTR74_009677 [Friedmanniomyces endolithicus]|nr:hypothetical protein LTR74_009677 [Friedmanniomyces endolithicus]
MDAWREEERKVAIMLLVVPLAVFVWKVAILLSPSSSSAFLPSAIRHPSEDGAGGSRSRGAIEYHDVQEGAEEGEADSVRAEVNRLNKDSSVATYVESGRAKAKNGLWQDHASWRESQ